MLAQLLNRDFLLAAVRASEDQLRTVIANREARLVTGPPTELDNLTTKELIRLKESGINEEILMAMQGYSESADQPMAESRGRSVAAHDPNDTNDPMTPHDIGIYLYTEKSGAKKMTELESNVVTGSRVGGGARRPLRSHGFNWSHSQHHH